MNKMLIISGPTATGKTSLAIKLANLFNGELISADSRQVYKGMDIGTGKELPLKCKIQSSKFKINEKKIPYYSSGNLRIWGYDLVEPSEEWSTAHFVKFAHKTISAIQKRNLLPIVVGGTGLYIKNLLNHPETLFVGQDKILREKLEKMSVKKLQDVLQRHDPARFNCMNESDQKNPRRLIRAIEISKQSLKGPTLSTRSDLNKSHDVLYIILTAPLDILDIKIEERVKERLNQGVEKEVRGLVEKYGWNSSLSRTIAYQEWKPYFEGDRTKENAIALWTIHEKQYARRQLTWLRKQPDLHWFDITNRDYERTVVRLAGQWYDENHDAGNRKTD